MIAAKKCYKGYVPLCDASVAPKVWTRHLKTFLKEDYAIALT